MRAAKTRIHGELDSVEMLQRLGVKRHPHRGTASDLKGTQSGAHIFQSAQGSVERLGFTGVDLPADSRQRVLDGPHPRAPVRLATHLVEPAHDRLALVQHGPGIGQGAKI